MTAVDPISSAEHWHIADMLIRSLLMASILQLRFLRFVLGNRGKRQLRLPVVEHAVCKKARTRRALSSQLHKLGQAAISSGTWGFASTRS